MSGPDPASSTAKGRLLASTMRVLMRLTAILPAPLREPRDAPGANAVRRRGGHVPRAERSDRPESQGCVAPNDARNGFDRFAVAGWGRAGRSRRGPAMQRKTDITP